MSNPPEAGNVGPQLLAFVTVMSLPLSEPVEAG